VIAAKKYNDSILEKEIQQQKQRRAWEHGRQVDSAVVSPLIKSLPDDGPYAAETCCKLENICKFKDILKYFNDLF
jgi:hypothetical protein